MHEFSQFKIENVYTLVDDKGSEGGTMNVANQRLAKDKAARRQVVPAPYIGKGRRPLYCDRCGKVFYRKSHMLKHILSYKYTCSTCDKPFRLKRELIVHSEAEHGHLELTELYTCIDCSYKTTMKSLLRTHILRHHSTEYSYFCKICQRGFKVKSDMNQHMRLMHCADRIVKCSICNATFNNDKAVQSHMRSIHNSFYYQCVQCRRYMASPESLEQHKQWHLEQKSSSVTCPKCGKVLRGRSLVAHLRVHTGQKPFTCPICGKSFRRLSPMERHVVIHTGKKPYVCDVCGQKFSQRPALLSHRERHPGPLPPLPVVSIKSIVKDIIVAYSCVKHESVEIDG